MTFESEDIIREMLENGGIYPGDPQVAKIYKYLSMTGRTLYAVFMEEYQNDMMESPYVRNPVLLWSRRRGLTEEGMKVINKQGEEDNE